MDETSRPDLPMDAHRASHLFPPELIAQIQRTADEGHYEIRGLGAKRKLPTFDDLLFLTASLTRYPLEGYREKCDAKTVLGTRFAGQPIELDIPITIAGMSFGALSATAKTALGRAATAVGTSTTTGDGGMIDEERAASSRLVYQCLPSRYGFRPEDLRRADAIEVVIGQGAKPGGGGLLLGQKVTERVARMRTLPAGVDQRSASRHPDWTGPDDLRIKIEELREATNWEKPIYVKFGATRVTNDVKLAVEAGADVVVVDGMQGGTAASQDFYIEHTGIPTLAAVRLAAEALRDIGMEDEVQLIVSGGIRTGADAAKALALGADAVSIGVASLIALGCNSPTYWEDGSDRDAGGDYRELGTAAGYCHHCHTGRCPVGIATQLPGLERRLDADRGARRVTNYLKSMAMELVALARACGKSNVHNLEPNDLVALTMEAAAMARVPLAGTDWIPGHPKGSW
jgi:methylamine---glutamate N-methyltransferase subunit C